ncbi:hypothetical protein LY78DRAFT_280600 [Colletotrichum sublineola]|nr:hypothetical protein LY78DRAFT_280600 [Colletotrichum sublineola]
MMLTRWRLKEDESRGRAETVLHLFSAEVEQWLESTSDRGLASSHPLEERRDLHPGSYHVESVIFYAVLIGFTRLGH